MDDRDEQWESGKSELAAWNHDDKEKSLGSIQKKFDHLIILQTWNSLGVTCRVVDTVVENGLSDTGSNPSQGCFILHCANTLEKGMNLTVLLTAVRK